MSEPNERYGVENRVIQKSLIQRGIIGGIMRLVKIISAVSVAVCLAASVPMTAEANSTSPYTRMNKVKDAGMMQNGGMMHSRMMARHHRMRHHRR